MRASWCKGHSEERVECDSIESEQICIPENPIVQTRVIYHLSARYPEFPICLPDGWDKFKFLLVPFNWAYFESCRCMFKKFRYVFESRRQCFVVPETLYNYLNYIET